ncbi:INO80 complex subunit E isoform X3 [Coturnix japonica]|uniref:INO80 complex subunit E n=1 Tax=Coturnix japonica TaxID=93934 RepID=A0A8C2T0V7_COTJA|nr:INO80 complex subunit E isoform X2 [Coturnix japonica]XP_015706280.1 INO80 complex subunit E isoform X3 [Coturnix japonica]
MGSGLFHKPEAEVARSVRHFRKMNGAVDQDGGGGSGCRRRYRALKRRLRLLLYEQECFQEELRRAQRRLLRVSRDKSFLLDRLLQYEQVDDDSSDSDATASSDSDGEAPKGAEPPPLKRKRSPTGGGASPPSNPGLAPPTSYLSTLGSPPYSPFPSDYLAPPERPRGPTRRNKGARRIQLPSAPPPPPPSLSFVPPAVLGSGSGSVSAPPPPPKAPGPVPQTVPRRLLSDGGDGSGDDGMDGDDELVIDIPEP